MLAKTNSAIINASLGVIEIFALGFMRRMLIGAGFFYDVLSACIMRHKTLCSQSDNAERIGLGVVFSDPRNDAVWSMA